MKFRSVANENSSINLQNDNQRPDVHLTNEGIRVIFEDRKQLACTANFQACMANLFFEYY